MSLAEVMSHVSARETFSCNLYIPDKDLVFPHIPRTGGRWRRGAIKFSCRRIGSWHDTLETLREKTGYPLNNVVLFIRGTNNWYSSVWSFLKVKLPSSKSIIQSIRLGPLVDCMDEDINVFMANVVKNCPNLYAEYTSEICRGYEEITFCRTENNRGDLIGVLEKYGIEVPSRIHHVAIPQSPNRPPIHQDLINQIIESENKIRKSLSIPNAY